MRNCHVYWWLICLQISYQSLQVGCGEYNNNQQAVDNNNNDDDDDIDASYNQLIRNLRDNWQSPVSYLKKRGYMPPSGSKEDERLQEEASALFRMNNYDVDQNQNIDESKSNVYPTLDFHSKYKKQSSADVAPPAPGGDSVSQPAAATSTNQVKVGEQSKSILSQMKSKIFNIFGSNEKAPININYEDLDESEAGDLNFIEMDSAGDNEEDEYLIADDMDRDPELDVISYDYDDSNIRQSRNIFPRSADVDCAPPGANVEQTAKSDAIPANSGLQDLIRDLSREDMEYVASFIKCFKETKNKLPSGPSGAQSIKSPEFGAAKNGTTTPKNGTGGATIPTGSHGSENATATNTTTSKPKGDLPKESNVTLGLDINQCDGAGNNLTQNNSTSNSSNISAISSTTPSSAAPININLTTTSEAPPQAPTKIPTDLLKFLAHLHHEVDQVGKTSRHKGCDLHKIQNIIDDSREYIAKLKSEDSVVLGAESSSQSTPLQLSDMSFNLEWKPQNLEGCDKRDDHNKETNRNNMNNLLDFPYEAAETLSLPTESLAARFLKELPKESRTLPLETPYADNFIEEQLKPFLLPVAPNFVKKKRHTNFGNLSPIEDVQNRKMSELLMDITSSMNSHKRDKNDDYLFSDDSEKDNMGDHEIGARRFKLRRKGKRKKKPKYRSDNDEYQNIVDITAIEGGNENEQKLSDDFNELNSFNFRVHPEQEADIAKFISNLDAPPEIFNFDVEKYLRSIEEEHNLNKLTRGELDNGLIIEPAEPAKTFYEFVGTPDIERKKVPLIDGIDYMAAQAQNNDKEKKSGTRKRDLLREYIKGVSSAIQHNHQHMGTAIDEGVDGLLVTDPESDKDIRSSEVSPNVVERTNELVNNYKTNYDAMNYMRGANPKIGTESESDNNKDDFVDHFYVLNDGSVPLFNTNSYEDVGKYSPSSVNIQLDLDKKFRELSLGNRNKYDVESSLNGNSKNNYDYYSSSSNGGNSKSGKYDNRDNLKERHDGSEGEVSSDWDNF